MNQEPLNPAGYLRGIRLHVQTTSNTGAFEELFTDPRYKRTWLRRCPVRKCQRPRSHDGPHYRRRRWRKQFSSWGGDSPWSVMYKLDEPSA